MKRKKRDCEETRIIHCPKCGLTVHAPADEALPTEGATCSMGHEPTPMVLTLKAVFGRG